MKGLIFRYYGIYVLLLGLFAAISYYMPVYEFTQEAKTVISTICIVFLLTIPLSLKLFSVKVKNNKTIKTKEEKIKNYMLWAQIQMYLIALPAVVSVVSYGLLRDRSSLFCYLIAFVALILCKPSNQKLEECTSSDDEMI